MAKRRHNRRRDDEPVNFWHSFVFKFSSRLLVGVFVILVFLSISQCTIRKPESPSWNTQFVLPVISRTYDMQELVERIDQDEISIDSAGNVAYSITQEIDTIRLAQSDLSTDDVNYAFAEQLGPVQISVPSFAPIYQSLSSLTGVATGLPGDTGTVPPQQVNVFNSLPAATTFSQATVSSGQVEARIINNLDIPLDTLIVTLVDVGLSRNIGVDTLAVPLASGNSANLPFDLSGETVSNDFRVDVSAYTPGGAVDSVSTRSLACELVFSDPFEVSSATAVVPALNDIVFTQKEGLNLGGGEQIDSASLETGSLNLSITNNTNLPATLTLTLSNLELGGSPFTLIQPVNANATVNLNQSLANYSLVPQNDSIDIDVVAVVPGSGGNQVLVDQNDDFSINAGLTNLSFASVSGIFNNSSAQFDNITESIDVPDGFDNIELLNAILTLEIENAIDLPGTLSIQIDASNGKRLLLSGPVEPRGNGQYAISTIVNDQVADFLSPLPDEVSIVGDVSFGDGVYQSTVTKDDYVFASVHIYAPLEVKVNNAEINDIDLEKEHIEQDDIDIITDHFLEGRFVYEITNHLPLGVTAILHFAGDSLSVYNSPQLTLDTLSALPAPVSLATGIANDVIVSSGEISLDSLDIKILENDTLYIRPQIFLNGSDTAGVKLTSGDYITITGRIEVEYRFDGEF